MSRSYYNRPWQGFVEVATSGGWTRVSEAINSVEAGLEFIQRQGDLLQGHEWRIVDLGDNIYEHGVVESQSADAKAPRLIFEYKTYPVPEDVAARQLAFYKFVSAPAHIAEAEQRRLLEEALKGEEEEDAAA